MTLTPVESMNVNRPNILYVTSGAGGMICGSCLHDNTLVRAMRKQGWKIQLMPTYTPIRTDEEDVSHPQILLGGINVFLLQKFPWLRALPTGWLRFLDRPRLLRWATSRSNMTAPATLGELTLSVLKGSQGNQAPLFGQMVTRLHKEQPGLVIFSNILIGGGIELLKRTIDVPVWVILQGDDHFLQGLPQPYRSDCWNAIQKIIPHVDQFIVYSKFYRELVIEWLGIEASKICVMPLGIDLEGYPAPSQETETATNAPATTAAARKHRTIGYLARLAPEKGLHHLVEAFLLLKREPEFQDVRLLIAGWLGAEHQAYAEAIWAQLRSRGLEHDYEYLGTIDRKEKISMLGRLDVFSVPTLFREPKGRYVLEAWAAGVPVVVPDHGIFPEWITSSGGGVLYEVGKERETISALAKELASLLRDRKRRDELGRRGQAFVYSHGSSSAMAAAMGKIIASLLGC